MNTELTVIEKNGEYRISSEEIAEKCHLTHKAVKQQITRFISKLEERGVVESHVQLLPHSNYKSNVYLLNKRQVAFLMMRFKGTEPVIRFCDLYEKKFNEMEQSQNPALPQNYKQALTQLLHSVEKQEQLQAEVQKKELQIEQQRPYVRFARTIANSDDAITVEKFAKSTYHMFGLGRNNMFKKLQELKYLIRSNQPYQYYIEQGLFRVKEIHIRSTDRISTQTLITAKGQSRLCEALAKHFNVPLLTT